MKTTHVARLCLLLLVSACAGRDAANATLPPESEPTELHTNFDAPPFGKLDGHGRLLFQELYQDGFPAGWHDTYVYYPRGSERSLKLNRDVSAINTFLAAEVYRPGTVHTFVKEYLTFFLRVILGDDPSIITARAVEQGLGSEPRSPDTRAQRLETSRLRAKLRPYACSPDPVVRGNGWTVDINVLTDQCAVEHWLVKGQIKPLRLDSFLCEPREPQGTFRPGVRTR